MKNYPHIIAYAGVAQAGKTSAANMTKTIIDAKTLKLNNSLHHYANCRILSYAGPIRESLEAIGIRKNNHPDLYRQMAQYIGARLREHDPDHWMNIMYERITKLTENDWVIIDDVRYWNEVNQLSEMGAVLIYVDPGNRMKEIIDTNELYKHESENMSVQIYNNHTLASKFQYIVPNKDNINKYRTEIERITNKIVWELVPFYR